MGQVFCFHLQLEQLNQLILRNNMEPIEEKIEIKSDATDIVEHLETLSNLSNKWAGIIKYGN